MDGTGDSQVKQNKPHSKRQPSVFLSCMASRKKDMKAEWQLIGKRKGMREGGGRKREGGGGI
jgi:hypothetical protein